MIDVDVETTGVQWYAHDLFLVAFRMGGVTKVLRHPDDRAEIQTILARGEEYRAWNSKFDMHFLEANGYTLHGRWYDGMVQAHLINAERSLALKSVAADMFGEGARGPEKEVHGWLNKEAARRRKVAKEENGLFVPPNYSDVPYEIMEPYAEQDVELTQAICSQFDMIFQREPELVELYEFEMDVMQAVYAMETRGVPVDEAAARKMQIHLAANLDEIEERCIALAGKPNFNPNSSQQIYEALKRRGADLRYCTRTKTGVSMDAESLGTVDDPLAEAVLQFRTENKILGTYIQPMLDETWDQGLRCMKAPFIYEGRIHPSIHQVGARTGRMSCSDPNMQNWPRDDLRLRYLVRAEPGNKLVTADLDSIEGRLFGAYAGGRVRDILMNDDDWHSITANSVGLSDRRRSSGAIEPKRQRGKTFNYAMIYGAGVRSLRKAFGVSQEEARQMIMRYHSAYPEVVKLQQDMEWVLQRRGYVKTAWGRRQRLPERNAYMLVNYVIQGTAAEILKAAAVRLHKAGVPLVLPVHDELIAECDEKDAPEVAHMIQEAMTDHPRITAKMPLVAEAKIVDRWSEAKDPTYKPDFL